MQETSFWCECSKWGCLCDYRVWKFGISQFINEIIRKQKAHVEGIAPRNLNLTPYEVKTGLYESFLTRKEAKLFQLDLY